ncbi:ketoacyl-ACP synthase III [Pirellulales bacterium]|nr:ketoacyl-ACP synthase III [Pirellulales bacterium]
MRAVLKAIEYYTPETVLTNAELAEHSAKWTPEGIFAKTGIAERRIAAEGECASDLAVEAAEQLFASGACRRDEVDFVLFCSQSPDYFLPTTACLLQQRLGLNQTIGALDFNLGCSGYLYGLGLAKGLVETGQACCVLLITAETYSKYIRPDALDVRTLFGDAAACSLIVGETSEDDVAREPIGPFVYGTDGRGGANLIAEKGGFRGLSRGVIGASNTNGQAVRPQLFMNGPEIFTFTLEAVPRLVAQMLERTASSIDDIDLFVFHQANKFMLDHLRDKIKIPRDRFFISMEEVGNTVSSTIPIALKHAQQAGRLSEGDTVMLVGFGVGYSWGAALLRWSA